jgi:hypothetical protein
MARNKYSFRVQISHVLRFICICDLLVNVPLNNFRTTQRILMKFDNVEFDYNFSTHCNHGSTRSAMRDPLH